MTPYEETRNNVVNELLNSIDADSLRDLARATLTRKFDNSARRAVYDGNTRLSSVIAEAASECRQPRRRARWFDDLR